jgi:hypothetical protein
VAAPCPTSELSDLRWPYLIDASIEPEAKLARVSTVRIGSSYYNAKWNFTRVLNEVYSNPTDFHQEDNI